jgi:dihydrofolate reductase
VKSIGPLRRADPALRAVEHADFGSPAKDELYPRTRRSLGAQGEPGKGIYLMGGARTAASLIDAGLVDELRLIVYPLIARDGKPLFATMERRRALELRNVQQLPGGRVSLT